MNGKDAKHAKLVNEFVNAIKLAEQRPGPSRQDLSAWCFEKLGFDFPVCAGSIYAGSAWPQHCSQRTNKQDCLPFLQLVSQEELDAFTETLR